MKYWSASLLLTFSLTIFANDMVIYRWVDENNVVHFSQNQPATGDYTEILMANAHNTSQELESPSNEKDVLTSKIDDEDEISENLTIDAAGKCNEAKKNLETLTTFDRIRFVDENGETQILDEAAQEEQISINKKRIEIYCKSSTASK